MTEPDLVLNIVVSCVRNASVKIVMFDNFTSDNFASDNFASDNYEEE